MASNRFAERAWIEKINEVLRNPDTGDRLDDDLIPVMDDFGKLIYIPRWAYYSMDLSDTPEGESQGPILH